MSVKSIEDIIVWELDIEILINRFFKMLFGNVVYCLS